MTMAEERIWQTKMLSSIGNRQTLITKKHAHLMVKNGTGVQSAMYGFYIILHSVDILTEQANKGQTTLKITITQAAPQAPT